MTGAGVMISQSEPAFPSAFEDRKKYRSVDGTPGPTPLTHAAHLGDNEKIRTLIASGQRIYVDRLSNDYEAFHRSQRLLRMLLASFLTSIFTVPLGMILFIFFPSPPTEAPVYTPRLFFAAATTITISLLIVGPFLLLFYVFLAKSYGGSASAMRIYTWVLTIVALIAGLGALYKISFLTYEMILSRAELGLHAVFSVEARLGVPIFMWVAASAATAYLFYIMLAGHFIALKDKDKLAILVDHSFPIAVFRNLIPNIFRVLGVTATNMLPVSRRRKAYALIVGLFGLACEGVSFGAYVNLIGLLTVMADHIHDPLHRNELAEELGNELGEELGALLTTLMIFVTAIMFVVPINLVASKLFSLLARRSKAFSQRLLLQNADEIRKFDNRPPILFLRSFADDQISLHTIHRSRHIKLLQIFDSGVHISTLDELLVQRYSYIGPVIAIGNPKNPIPPLGASRKYVEGMGWEEIAISLMRQSAIIVIVVGDTESLLWEVHQVGLLGLHRKAIFVMPPDRTKDYCLMRRVTEAVMATAGAEQLLGKDTNGPMSREYNPKNGEHILSIVYDDEKTCFTCIAQSNRVTEMR